MKNSINQLQIALQRAINALQVALDLTNALSEQIDQLDNEKDQSQFASVVLPEDKETPQR